MHHIKLLCDIGELNHLFRDSVSVESFLQRTVTMVTEHLKTEVCSIYLYDEDDETLVMHATEGLNPDSVGHVSMRLGEGLTGKSLKEMQPICVSRAGKHPDYKPFVGTNEELYDNFLAVPITRALSKIGVLVLQRKKKRRFSEEDVLACKAVASQLANIIENARFLMAMHEPREEKKKKKSRDEVPEGLEFVRGRVASAGYCFSQCHVIDREKTFEFLSSRQYETNYTIEDFTKAVKATESQLEKLQKQVEEKLTDAASLIFASHLLILKDHEFIGAMHRLIEQGTAPPEAVIQIARRYIDIFLSSQNVYVREKVQDVEDLVGRLMGNLVREFDELGDHCRKVVIADELFPSDLLRMSSEEVDGVVLVGGGITSHLAILARSLQIPMVVANEPKLMDVPDKTPVLVDADTGNVYVNPPDDVIDSFKKRNLDRATIRDHIASMKPKTFTTDGTRVVLLANINLLNDVTTANELLSEGVGLYRTEFPFIIRSDFPSEEEQYVTYSKLVNWMDGRPVTFRTLDIGGDKVLSYYHNAREQNPAMGMRSIRFSLQNHAIFARQLRAMLRAGAGADLRIMFPMISSMDDFAEAKSVLNRCLEELKRAGVKHNSTPQVGIMIELPSIVHLAEALARQADFFSIGTNDFIQFMLGVDRTNQTVENFYIPHHPAVLRGIMTVISAAAANDIDLSICGDMANDLTYVPLLVGMGVRTFSVDPIYLPRVQQRISELEIGRVRRLAESIMSMNSESEIARSLGIRRLE